MVQRRSSDLAGCLAVVELFGEQLDPLQHGGLGGGRGDTLASPHRKHFRLKAPKCQFYLLLGVDESLEDERGAELQRRGKKNNRD